jgi:ribosomal protein S27AE
MMALLLDGTKACSACRRERPAREFPYSPSRLLGGDGRTGVCYGCVQAKRAATIARTRTAPGPTPDTPPPLVVDVGDPIPRRCPRCGWGLLEPDADPMGATLGCARCGERVVVTHAKLVELRRRGVDPDPSPPRPEPLSRCALLVLEDLVGAVRTQGDLEERLGYTGRTRQAWRVAEALDVLVDRGLVRAVHFDGGIGYELAAEPRP